jgi:hypothetical protein
VKHFVIYTVLRIALFLATFAVVSTIAVAIFDDEGVVWLVSLLGAAVISSILSLKLLAAPRERFAQSVQARADRASAKFEEIKSREDTD